MSDTKGPLMPEGTSPESAVVPTRPILLSQAREAAGLHIAALAAALKVPVKKLEALEAGRYEELPDMTFARALASAACRQLKVDPAPVLEQIPAAVSPLLGDSSQTINAPFKPAGDTPVADGAAWLRQPVVLIVALLLAGAAVVYWWPAAPQPPESVMPPGATMAPGTVEPPTAPAADAAAPAGSVTEAGNSTTVALTAPVAAGADTPAMASPTAAITASASVSVSTPTAMPAPEASAASTALLKLTASGDSWVEVVNARGEVVVQRLLKAGDSVDFSSAPPYSVVVGRADAVQVTVRGQPLDIAPYARNSVARFEVK